jgi:hypothetical protein
MKLFTDTNKKIFNKLIREKLTTILNKVGLQIADWQIDENLLKAFFEQQKTKKNKQAILKLLDEYDALIDSSRKMKVSINNNFLMFYQIGKTVEAITKTTK